MLHDRELTPRERGACFFANAESTPSGVKGLGVRVSSEKKLPVSQIACHVNGVAPQLLSIGLANTARITSWLVQVFGGGRYVRFRHRQIPKATRSEERRVGKECRSRWSP